MHGLRGSISYEFFNNQGYDLFNLKFINDPEFLVRFIFSDLVNELKSPVKWNLIFIRHYRDRS